MDEEYIWTVETAERRDESKIGDGHQRWPQQ